MTGKHGKPQIEELDDSGKENLTGRRLAHVRFEARAEIDELKNQSQQFKPRHRKKPGPKNPAANDARKVRRMNIELGRAKQKPWHGLQLTAPQKKMHATTKSGSSERLVCLLVGPQDENEEDSRVGRTKAKRLDYTCRR
jgi:hypothetical protein